MLIGVIVIAVILTAVIVNMQKRVSTLPERLTENVDWARSKNLRDFVLQHALEEAHSLEEEESWVSEGIFHRIIDSDFKERLSERFGGTVDTIRYFALDAERDNIRISTTIKRKIGSRLFSEKVQAEVVYKINEHPEEEQVGYDFNESHPDSVFDSSGKGNDGALGGGDPDSYPERIEDGKDGSALDFDGDNDYVNAGTEVLSEDDDGLTVATWVNFGDIGTDWGDIAAEYKSPDDPYPVWALRARKTEHLLLPATIKLAFDVCDESGFFPYSEVSVVETEYSMDFNAWNYVVATYEEKFGFDDAEITISVLSADGTKIGSDEETIDTWKGRTEESYVTIGGKRTLIPLIGELFCTNARVDEVKILNRAVNDREIEDLCLYNGIKESRLAYWIY